MKKVEWIRETLTTWPSLEYLEAKQAAGWRLMAMEWEREVETHAPASIPAPEAIAAEQIPYGTRIAGDCLHLEDNPTEMEILNLLAEMVVQDLSYNHMAEMLNQRGFQTREAKPWTALAVFKLTPRLIEVAPRILSGVQWENRKKQLSRVTWNS
jgi:Recombinase